MIRRWNVLFKHGEKKDENDIARGKGQQPKVENVFKNGARMRRATKRRRRDTFYVKYTVVGIVKERHHYLDEHITVKHCEGGRARVGHTHTWASIFFYETIMSCWMYVARLRGILLAHYIKRFLILFKCTGNVRERVKSTTQRGENQFDKNSTGPRSRFLIALFALCSFFLVFKNLFSALCFLWNETI